jgi:hypothetical protein
MMIGREEMKVRDRKMELMSVWEWEGMRSEKRCKVVLSESFNDVLDDEIDELVLQHRLRVEVGDQERDIISLSTHSRTATKQVPNQCLHPTLDIGCNTGLTGIAFLLKITNPSARMVMNLVNFLHKILSISSACLIQMDSRIELMDGSMRTRSDSLREMRRGWRRVSCELLWGMKRISHWFISLWDKWVSWEDGTGEADIPSLDFRVIMPLNDLRSWPPSISPVTSLDVLPICLPEMRSFPA